MRLSLRNAKRHAKPTPSMFLGGKFFKGSKTYKVLPAGCAHSIAGGLKVGHAFCRLRELSPRQPPLSCKQLHSPNLPWACRRVHVSSLQSTGCPLFCSPAGRSCCVKAGRFFIVFQTKAPRLALCCLAPGINQSPYGILFRSPRWQHRLPPSC